MGKKGLRLMALTVLWLLLIGGAGYGALQYAIGRNGPAVLDAIDRIAGGSRDVALIHRETIGSSSQQKILVYRDSVDTGPKPVIIFFHGGSWRSGDPDDYGFIARALVPEGFTVILAGYRLVPGGEYPAMLEDTAEAVAWTSANITRYGGNPNQIFLAGHSAGAYNVVAAALDRQWLGREGLNPDVLKGVIGLSGPYDFLPLDSDSTKAAFGGARDIEATQPINHVRADAPPLLLVHGEQDTLVYPRNTVALTAALTKAGGSANAAYFQDMDHNAPLLALASPWRRNPRMVDAITDFAKAALSSHEAGGQASVPVQAAIR